MAYIKRKGNGYDKAAAPDVPQPWDPNVPKTPDELPTFAAGDAGKVLAVNDDGDGVEWAETSGGGGALIVDVEKDSSTYTAGKTFEEIAAAIDAGQDVILDLHDKSSNIVIHARLTLTEYWLAKSGGAYTNMAYITWTGHLPIETTKTPQVAHRQLRMLKTSALTYSIEAQS